jgi:hypothetical protein
MTYEKHRMPSFAVSLVPCLYMPVLRFSENSKTLLSFIKLLTVFRVDPEIMITDKGYSKAAESSSFRFPEHTGDHIESL